MEPKSRAANQTKPEPFPASSTEAEAETPASDHPGAADGATGTGGGDVGDAAGVPVVSEQPSAGTSETTPVAEGLHVPDVEEPDVRSTGL